MENIKSRNKIEDNCIIVIILIKILSIKKENIKDNNIKINEIAKTLFLDNTTNQFSDPYFLSPSISDKSLKITMAIVKNQKEIVVKIKLLLIIPPLIKKLMAKTITREKVIANKAKYLFFLKLKILFEYKIPIIGKI